MTPCGQNLPPHVSGAQAARDKVPGARSGMVLGKWVSLAGASTGDVKGMGMVFSGKGAGE